MEWGSPALALTHGEGFWQSRAGALGGKSTSVHRLCRAGEPFPYSCAPLAMRRENLRCRRLQGRPNLGREMGTPELLLVVTERGRRSH